MELCGVSHPSAVNLSNWFTIDYEHPNPVWYSLFIKSNIMEDGISIILWRWYFARKPKYQDQAEGPDEEQLAQPLASGRLLSKTQ